MVYGFCTGTQASLYFLSQVGGLFFFIKLISFSCTITTIWVYMYLHYIFIHSTYITFVNILHMPDLFILICSELFEMLIFSNSDTSVFWGHNLKKNKVIWCFWFCLDWKVHLKLPSLIKSLVSHVSALVVLSEALANVWGLEGVATIVLHVKVH